MPQLDDTPVAVHSEAVQFSQRDIDEGRALAADTNQWALGDKANRVAPIGQPAVRTGREAIIDAYASEIGVKPPTLRIYASVAAALAPMMRVVGASWTVHRELMAPHLQHLIEPGLTAQDAIATRITFEQETATRATAEREDRLARVASGVKMAEAKRQQPKITNVELGQQFGNINSRRVSENMQLAALPKELQQKYVDDLIGLRPATLYGNSKLQPAHVSALAAKVERERIPVGGDGELLKVLLNMVESLPPDILTNFLSTSMTPDAAKRAHQQRTGRTPNTTASRRTREEPKEKPARKPTPPAPPEKSAGKPPAEKPPAAATTPETETVSKAEQKRRERELSDPDHALLNRVQIGAQEARKSHLALRRLSAIAIEHTVQELPAIASISLHDIRTDIDRVLELAQVIKLWLEGGSIADEAAQFLSGLEGGE